MRAQVSNKARHRGEWCPYCGKFSAELLPDKLVCHSCGYVAELTPAEYEKIKTEYGPGGTKVGVGA